MAVTVPRRRWLTHLGRRTSVHRDGCSAARAGARQHLACVAARRQGAGMSACFSFAQASMPLLSPGSLPADVHRRETLLLLGLRRRRRIVATATKICAACASTASRDTPSAAHARPPTSSGASAAA